jgi:hypothetical protein
MKRIRIKIKVIFIPYWSFATSGLSLLQRLLGWPWKLEGVYVHESKHLSADGKWEGDDEEHEECHLCHEQEEDLCANVLASFSGDVKFRSRMTKVEMRYDC